MDILTKKLSDAEVKARLVNNRLVVRLELSLPDLVNTGSSDLLNGLIEERIFSGVAVPEDIIYKVLEVKPGNKFVVEINCLVTIHDIEDIEDEEDSEDEEDEEDEEDCASVLLLESSL